MWSIFKGWRRMAGCVFLAIAFALMILWVRSVVREESVRFEIGESQHELISRDSFLQWRLKDREGWVSLQDWRTNDYRELTIEYCPLILMLSLLSAGLILWKPRKRVTPLRKGPSCRVAE